MNEQFYTFYRRQGNSILLREKQENGKTKSLKINDFSPRLWIESDKETGYKTINGKPVDTIPFHNMSDAWAHYKTYQDVEGFNLYGTKDFALDYICQRYGKASYDSKKIRTFTIDIEVKTDGEFPKPEEAKFPIDCLTVHDSIKDVYYCFSLYDLDTSDERIKHLNVLHKKFDNEVDLLTNFIHFWYQLDPDNFTGWNTNGFDTPYLYFRITKILGDDAFKRMSPFGKIKEKETVDKYYNKMISIEIVGVADLDYIKLYQKHTFETRESYTLDFIGKAEGVGQKTEYDEETLHELSAKDPQTYQVYNIIDVNIVVELDRKLKLLNVTYALSYMSNSNYVDTLGTTKQWENFVYSYLYLNKNVLPPAYPQNTSFREFPGGYVKEPKPGKYGWLVSFDFASLYPHLVMHQNLGPETIVSTSQVRKVLEKMPEYSDYANTQFMDDLGKVNIDNCVNKELPEKLLQAVKDLNLCLAPNGSMYRKDKKSFFNEMMDYVYHERKSVKGIMNDKEKEFEKIKDALLKNEISALDAMQMAFKIMMNSGYGAISNEYFHYFLIDIAEAITTAGQTSVQWVTNAVDKHMNEMLGTNGTHLVYIDTDSGYFDVQKVVDQYLEKKPDATNNQIVDMLDKFCDKVIQPVIQKSCQELADYMNAYKQRLDMKREVIAESGIWLAKKRYTLAMWDKEGVRYEEPKIKITGLESVRSTTPSWSKDYLKKLYKISLLGSQDDVYELYNWIEQDFHDQPVVKIAMPTGVNNIKKYSDENGYAIKGTQAHIRSAINYNRLIKEMSLKNYGPITDSEKIKYLHLKPNPLHVDVLAFKSYIPKEFDIIDYVDKQKTFEKGFLSAANSFLKPIGWELERKASLEGLFD